MNALARFAPGDELSRLFLSSLLQATAVTLVAAAAAHVLLSRSAAARHGLWFGALLWVTLSPVIAAIADHSRFLLWSVSLPLPATVESESPHRSLPNLGPNSWVSAPAQVHGIEPKRSAPRSIVRLHSTGGLSDRPIAAEHLGRVVLSPVTGTPSPTRTIVGNASEATEVHENGAKWRDVVLGGLTVFWVAGALVGLARIVTGMWWVTCLSRAIRPFDPLRHREVLDEVRKALGTAELPQIGMSPKATGPVAAGFLRPRVVLPEGLPDILTRCELRDVLVHECAHVLRRDLWIGLLQRFAGALFWPHPLIHYLNGQLSVAREEICDNHVIRCGDACGYARTLLRLTKLCRPLVVTRAGIGLLWARWTLGDRITGLLDPRRMPVTRTNARTRIIAAASLVATGLAVAGVRPERQTRANGLDVKDTAISAAAPETLQKPGPGVEPDTVRDTPPSVPAGPSREEIAELIRAVGRDPVTSDLVDQIAFRFRSQVLWASDFSKARRLITAPDFVHRIDAIAQNVFGKPADTLTLLGRAARYHVGYDDAALMHFLREEAESRSRSVSVEGTVRDAYTGRPVAVARVFTDSDMVRTDDTGRFTLQTKRPVERAPYYGVLLKYWVEAEGYALREAVAQPLLPREQSIHLLREVVFVGQVLDDKGQPVEGADVRASVERTAVSLDGSDRLTGGGNVVVLQVRTDKEGRFSVRGVPPTERPVRIQVLHPLYQTAHDERVAPTTPEMPFVVRLRPGCIVAGVVVEKQDIPVPGASVELRKPSSRGYEHLIHTDDQGRFRFQNVSPGNWDLLVQPERQAAAHTLIVADGARPVDIPVAVAPGFYIQGVVLGSNGEPVGRAAVGWAESLGGEFHNLGRMTSTATDGTFRLGPLPPGEFRLTGLAESPRRLGRILAKTNQTDARIHLKPDPIPDRPR